MGTSDYCTYCCKLGHLKKNRFKLKDKFSQLSTLRLLKNFGMINDHYKSNPMGNKAIENKRIRRETDRILNPNCVRKVTKYLLIEHELMKNANLSQ